VQGVVGRDRELADVAAFMRSVGEGAAALLIHGDAGIGKTTLWRAAVAEARVRSHHVLVCRASEAEAAFSFLGLADLFEEVPADAVEALPDPQRRALDAALLRTDAVTDRLALARATVGALRALALERPTVVAIDDVQWLDAPSTDALRFAARRLEGAQVGFTLAARGSIDPVPFELERALDPGRLVRLHVEPLSSRDLQALVTSRVRIRFGRPGWVALHRISGGNPFFALQLAEAAAATGLELGGGFPVPASIADVVGERLEGLSEGTRESLLLVAALAQPTRDVVAPDVLAEALDAGIVERDGNRIRFSHPLFSSVLYARASPARRREAHRRLATLVADAEERAVHLARGTDLPDEPVARELEDAAERASRRGHPETAAELALHAERLTVGSGAAALRATAAAVYLYAAGDGRRSVEILERVVATLSAGHARAGALRLLGWVEDDVISSSAHLRQALREAGDDPQLRAQIHQQLSRTEVFRGDWAEGVRHAQAAVEWAERAGDRAVLATALGRHALTMAVSGKGLRLEVLDRAVELERTLERPLRLSESPTVLRGVVLLSADRFDDARAAFDEAYQRGLALGDVWRGIVLTFMTELECRNGHWTRALALAVEGEDLATQWAVADGEAWGLYGRGLVEAHLGNVEAARGRLDRASELTRRIHNAWVDLRVQSALAFLAVSLGDAATALAHFDKLLATPVPMRALPDAVEASVATGDLERALAMTAELERRAAATSLPSVVTGAARSRAIVAAACGDTAGAAASVGHALAAHKLLDEPFEQARTLLVAGTIARRAKRKRDARDALAAAEKIFARLGARLWLEKARAELERVGVRHGPGVLTATEQRVAHLAARGATNKEIASALFMSVKTVEANLSRIYGKLSVRSRTELASRLARSPGVNGGTPPPREPAVGDRRSLHNRSRDG
jgi:DNA-binding CsgD family transcriptional regulator